MAVAGFRAGRQTQIANALRTRTKNRRADSCMQETGVESTRRSRDPCAEAWIPDSGTQSPTQAEEV